MATYVEPFDDGDEPLRASGWKLPPAAPMHFALPPEAAAAPYLQGKLRHAVGWFWGAALIASLGMWYGVYLIIAFANSLFPFPVLH